MPVEPGRDGGRPQLPQGPQPPACTHQAQPGQDGQSALCGGPVPAQQEQQQPFCQGGQHTGGRPAAGIASAHGAQLLPGQDQAQR